jgi:hypothetical protein
LFGYGRLAVIKVLQFAWLCLPICPAMSGFSVRGYVTFAPAVSVKVSATWLPEVWRSAPKVRRYAPE